LKLKQVEKEGESGVCLSDDRRS